MAYVKQLEGNVLLFFPNIGSDELTTSADFVINRDGSVKLSFKNYHVAATFLNLFTSDRSGTLILEYSDEDPRHRR